MFCVFLFFLSVPGGSLYFRIRFVSETLQSLVLVVLAPLSSGGAQPTNLGIPFALAHASLPPP